MDVTKRFSDRVENYIRYRPGYPAALIDHIVARCGLRPEDAVADVGSGTGIFAALLLVRGFYVFGVEPNDEMREAGERLLARNERFTSVNGTAEHTGLPDRSVRLITSAQAFHWFDGARAQAEFRRVLRNGGMVTLIWNDRKIDSTPFLTSYDALLRASGTDYEKVNHRNIDADRLRAFFGSGGYEEAVFPNEQRFDWAGLFGRAMSSSYVPAEGAPGYDAFVSGLRDVFNAHAVGDEVAFEYDTRLYLGKLD